MEIELAEVKNSEHQKYLKIQEYEEEISNLTENFNNKIFDIDKNSRETI